MITTRQINAKKYNDKMDEMRNRKKKKIINLEKQIKKGRWMKWSE